MTSRFYYTARYISWVLSEIIELLRYIWDTSGYNKIHESFRIHSRYMQYTLGYVSDKKPTQTAKHEKKPTLSRTSTLYMKTRCLLVRAGTDFPCTNTYQ